MNSLPYDITDIDLSYCGLDELPDLTRFTLLETLNVSNNHLEYIPDLTHFTHLIAFICDHNYIERIGCLSASLEILICNNNSLINLPSFPENLWRINCSVNQIRYLPKLNSQLNELICYDNNLTDLPDFNRELRELNCSHNNISVLPAFNEYLHTLNVRSNNLTSLPELTANLWSVECDHNPITHLPYLGDMSVFICSNTPIGDLVNCNCNITKLKHTINGISKFRQFYFINKFGPNLKAWLWKVRETIAKNKYSPTNLLCHLQTIDDTDGEAFDHFMETW